eukprot:scaffold44699_cov17-Tisochrysis_lutea.AAC.3
MVAGRKATAFIMPINLQKPADRLGWPELLDHPFVRETVEERVRRERALAEALEVADSSRAWRVEVKDSRAWKGACAVFSMEWWQLFGAHQVEVENSKA